MNFKELESQFWQLKGKQSAGLINDDEFNGQVVNLRTQDTSGQWWTINPVDGTWLIYQGQTWVPGKPPSEEPEVFPPPPPPEPLTSKPVTPSPKPSKAKEEKTVVPEQPSGDARPRPKRKPRPRVAPSDTAEEVAKTVSPKPKPPPVSEAPPPEQRPRERYVPPVPPPERDVPPVPPRENVVPPVPPQERVIPPVPPRRAEAKPKPPRPKQTTCPQCGSPYDAGDKFCGDCGYSFPVIQRPQRPQSRPQPRPVQEQETRTFSAKPADQAPGHVKAGEKARKGLFLVWIIGAMIYTAIIFLLISYVEGFATMLGQHTLALADVLAGILIFTFLLSKNGIKLKYKPGGVPGRDILFVVGFGFVFALVTKIPGPWIMEFLAAFITEIFSMPLEGDGFIVLFIVLTYLIYVSGGILVSIIGLNLAPRILKKS